MRLHEKALNGQSSKNIPHLFLLLAHHYSRLPFALIQAQVKAVIN
jgi:hypothetical protein